MSNFTDYDRLQTKLALKLDVDVLKILHFMERNMRAAKLVPAAELVAKLAPILWGYFDREEIYPVHLDPNGEEFEMALKYKD